MIASSALWFSHSPKNCVLMLTMRGKQWGRQGGGLDSPNSPEACRGSHTAQTSFTLQLWNSSCFKVVLRRDWQQLQTSLSFALWVRWEPLNGKPREREKAPSANRRHLLHHAHFLGVRHIHLQLVAGLFTLSDVPLWQFNKSVLHRFVANGGILEESCVNY